MKSFSLFSSITLSHYLTAYFLAHICIQILKFWNKVMRTAIFFFVIFLKSLE
jgi:hypothetical protein